MGGRLRNSDVEVMMCGYGNICIGCNRCGKSTAMPGKKRLCLACGTEPPADAKYCPVCKRKLPPVFPPVPGEIQAGILEE